MQLWLSLSVLQTQAWGAGASGGTFLGCEVWKVPHGSGIGLGTACLSRGEESVCIPSGEGAVPPAHVGSCWHFHPFNHRLRGMLWEVPAGWRSCSEWAGLSLSCSQTACQSLTSG